MPTMKYTINTTVNEIMMSSLLFRRYLPSARKSIIHSGTSFLRISTKIESEVSAGLRKVVEPVTGNKLHSLGCIEVNGIDFISIILLI